MAETFSVDLPEPVAKREGVADQARGLGMMLGQAFKAAKAETLKVDGWQVSRIITKNDRGDELKSYSITKTATLQTPLPL